MEKLTTSEDDLLMDFLDGNLNAIDLQKLKQRLESSATLQARLEELRVVHNNLSKVKIESPSHGFVARVMQSLHSRGYASYLSPRNGLFLLIGILVAAGAVALMAGAGVFNSGITISLKSIQPAQPVLQKLPTFSLDLKVIVNLVIGVNLVLAFLILDRTILRPYFNKRRLHTQH